jgi:hypothetical protein
MQTTVLPLQAAGAAPSDSKTGSKEPYWANKSQWAKSYFRKDASGWTCKIEGCTKTYALKTSPVNLEYHLVGAHKHTIPASLDPSNKRPRSAEQSCLTQLSFHSKEDQDLVQMEKIVVAYCMNFRVASNSFDNIYWKDAFRQSIPDGMRSAKALRHRIRIFSDKLKNTFLPLLRGTLTSLQMDGGKSITRRKLLGICVVLEQMALLLECFDTNHATLNKEYYRDVVARVVVSLMELQCITVGITCDNEASPNAGVELAISTRPACAHLIHFRCGCHTCELVTESLADAFPELQEAISEAKEITKHIRNNKVLEKALQDLQTSNNVTEAHVLGVCMSNNTRKWASGYGMISRLVKLEVYVLMLQTNPAYTLPATNFPRLKAALKMLFEFYLLEQIMQRDGSNALHLSFCWRRISDMFEIYIADLRQRFTQPRGEEPEEGKHTQLQADWDKRHALMCSSKVYHLFAALWPDPNGTNNAFPLKRELIQEAYEELDGLVAKQWHIWQRFPKLFLLPDSYVVVSGGPTPSSQNDFILRARGSLTQHLTGATLAIRRAREAFQVSAVQVETLLRGGGALPDRKRRSDKLVPVFNPRMYWSSLGWEHPELYVIYNVGEHCSATEAAVERLFSTEAICHDRIRNRMRAATVEAIMSVRWNLGPVAMLLNRLQLAGKQEFKHVFNNQLSAEEENSASGSDNDKTDEDE